MVTRSVLVRDPLHGRAWPTTLRFVKLPAGGRSVFPASQQPASRDSDQSWLGPTVASPSVTGDSRIHA